MGLLMDNVTSGREKSPPFILLYGVEGIGKSTFAADAPNPIFLPTEDGLKNIDIPNKLPVSRTYDQFMTYLAALCEEDHEYQTVVIDSGDWLEKLVHAKVADDHNKPSVEGIGYGKGYIFAQDYFSKIREVLDWLQTEKNMGVIIICHAQVKRFNDPETEAYDMYKIKLHDLASAHLQEKSDIVAFVNYRKAVVKDDMSNKKRAIGRDERVLYTTRRAAFSAKNRYRLPAEIPFTDDGAVWRVFAQHIPFYQQED